VQATRIEKAKPFEIIYATITVRNGDISSGEMTVHGLVFLISGPCVGSS
jgi:hypothetical protein